MSSWTSTSWLALSLLLFSEVSTSAVGRTVGEASVSPTGDSVYVVPIRLPDGINGLTPDLSLSYSHSQPEGLAGVGWGITGLSVISRCQKTTAQDGAPDTVELERSDRLCLDGNQLRLTSGSYGYANSQYRTEVDLIARVTAYGSAGDGPAWFKVESKAGLIYEYGNSTDSRIESLATGDESTVRVWALNKISDRSGNEIQIFYDEDGPPYGTYRPSYIYYGINPSAGQSSTGYKLTFVYESQPAQDVDTSYATGGIVEDIKRLTAIDIDDRAFIVLTRIRSYELEYESSLSSANRSRLASVKECGRSTGNCLEPISFVYQDGTNSLNNEVLSGSTIPAGTRPIAMDINGDGRTDFAYPSAASGGTWMYRLANTSGGYAGAVNTGISSNNHADAIIIDHNSDGLDDILVPYSGSTWWAMHGSTSGLSSPVNTLAAHSNLPGNATAYDWNGDGRDDLIWGENVGINYTNGKVWVQERNTSGNGFGTAAIAFHGTYYVRLAGPTLFGAIPQDKSRNFDVNGDGWGDIGYIIYMPPMYFAPPIYRLLVLKGNSQGSHSTDVTSTTTMVRPIDLNGDGYTDMAYGIGSILYSRISTGTSFGSVMNNSHGGINWTNSVVVDWNGDGMEDLLAPHLSNGKWYVALSDGFRLSTVVSTGSNHNSPIHAFAADSNGDGLHDVAYVTNANAFVHRTHAGVKPDLLKTVTDGHGNTVEFHYAPLTDSSVYTKGSGAVLPIVDYLEPRTVVKTFEQSDGIGSTYSIGYQYEGAKRNIEGRGIGGFEKRIVTDNRSGNVVTETYHTDFPYRGRVKKRELHLSDSTLVQEITHTWNKLTAGTGFQNYHFPYISNTTEKNFEAGGTYNGDQINTVSTTSTVDGYGTPYDVTVVTTEHTNANGVMPGISFTERTYTPTGSLHNVTSTWCLGRRQQVRQINSHTSTYGSSITRTTDYTWDTTSNCRVTKKVVEPSSSNYKVTVDLEYDQFGNIDKHTVTGVDAGATMSARVTEIGWSANGLHPDTVKNPLLQTTTASWDQYTGDLLSVTDPNSLTRSWTYDDFNRLTRETKVDGTFVDYSFMKCTSADNYCYTGNSSIETRRLANSKTNTGGHIRYDILYFDSYDRELRRQSQVIGGGYSRTKTFYDASGRIWKRSSPTLGAFKYAETTYDALGRPTRISRPVHDATTALQHTNITYEGLKTTTTDAEGHSTWKIADALGRVYQSHDDLAHYQQFDFDAFGSVKKVQDCVLTTCDSLTELWYAYGVDAHKTKSVDMSLGEWDYSYNSLGELTAYNDANTGGTLPGTATASYTWDKLGRALTRTEAEGTTTWTWGVSAAAKNIGRLHSVSSPGHSQTFNYDTFGRLAKHTRNGGGTYVFDYAYNSSTGFLSSIQYPASTGGYRFKILQEYDHGILKRVKRSDAGQTVYWEAQTQDAFGNIIDEDYGNGTTTIRSFDGVTGRLDYIDTDNGALQNLTYSWDKVGNLESRKDWRQTGNPTELFGYDSLNRLTDADVSGAATFNLGIHYDENGNIDVKDDLGAGTWTYHTSNKHAVISAGGNSYGYDDNGNMTSRKGDTITWTSYNYPSEIDDGPRTYQYSYDADRQKWKQVFDDGSTSETTYFAGRAFEKNVNSSDTDHRHYVMANGRAVAMFVERSSQSDYVRYFTHDHLGSTDGIVFDSGTLDVAESFSAFGERRDPIDWVGDPPASDLSRIADLTDRGYTDHISLEGSTLVHMNGRVYDAEIGRFLSPDPYVFNPMSTQGFNRYAYVQNNPMRYADPSGFECLGFDWLSCGITFGLSTFFGLFGDDDGGPPPPPPPDFCKDNTRGCGGPLPGIEIRFTLNLYYLPQDDKKNKRKKPKHVEWFECIFSPGSRESLDCNWRITIHIFEEAEEDVVEAAEEAAEQAAEVAATSAECTYQVFVGQTTSEKVQNVGEELAKRAATRAIDEIGNAASETVQDVLHRAQGKAAGKLIVKRAASVAPVVGAVVWTVDSVRVAVCTHQNMGVQN